MKKIYFLLIAIFIFTVFSSNSVFTSSETNQKQIYKKHIKGKIIYTNLLGYRLEKLGYIKLKTPNILTIRLLDVSIADASSKHIKTVVYKNIKSLPFDYSIDIKGIAFKPGHTYVLSVFLDINMNNKYTKGNFHNSRRMTVPFDTTEGDIVEKEIYIGRIDK